ncbi:Carbon-nitrogen hydrolase, partial [Cladochytrium tenue]
GDVNLLILPELAFTGYVFESRDAIAPFVEPDGPTGPTASWARRVAVRLGCHVQVGYPRRSTAAATAATGGWRNSVCVAAPGGDDEGVLVATYDKHFLYEVDERWAEEGDAFKAVELPLGREGTSVKVGFGICMDVNPYRFTAPFNKFEFAWFHRHAGTRLVSGSMAWVLSKDGDDADTDESEEDRSEEAAAAPVTKTWQYWMLRMMPLWKEAMRENVGEDDDDEVHSEDEGAEEPEEKETRVVFAACNRTGGENGTKFCGSSAVFEMRRRTGGGGGVQLLGG